MHPKEAYLQSQTTQMLVDREKVSMDGTECNKIGVSYDAFKAQGNQCGMSEGTCLLN